MSGCGRCGSAIKYCQCDVCERCDMFTWRCSCDDRNPIEDDEGFMYANWDTPEDNENAREIARKVEQ